MSIDLSNGSATRLESGRHESNIALKKQLGLLQSVALIVSSMVGSGIFITPGEVLRRCGSIPAAIIVWAVSGVLHIFGALMYAELGTMMPKSGGDYHYLLQIIGPIPAFLFAWTRVVLRAPSSLATSSLTFGNYFLFSIYPCAIPQSPRYILAVLAVMVFGYLNCRSAKWAYSIQNVFAVGKAAALAGILIAGIYSFANGGAKFYADGFSGTSNNPLEIALSFYSAFFAYFGWNFLTFVAEEIEEPEKNIWRSICIGLGTVTLLYVLANVSYFAMIPIDQAISSPAIAVTALGALYEPLGTVITVLVSLSVFGTLNSSLLTVTRVGFSAARNGHMPVPLAYISIDYLTPIISIVITGLFALVYISIGQLSVIINMNAFGETFFYCVTSIAYFYQRRQTRAEPDANGRITIVIPIIFFVAMVLINVLSFIREPAACAGSLALILGGIIFYFVFCVLLRPPHVQHFFDTIAFAIQKATSSVFQEE